MCPNCNRGLVGGELCTVCAGTGFWNPASVSTREAETIMTTDSSVTVGTPVVEGQTTAAADVASAAPKAPKKKTKKK